MLPKTFTTAAVALAASTLVAAQTSTECNPLEKSCPADPAFGNDKENCDFTKGGCDAFDSLPGTTLKYNGNGAVFSISTEKEAPTIRTGKYIFFGRIDVVVQAAAGPGIVTSAVLQSDDLDEIDWEWVGGDNGQAQTNYFSKGNTATYDRGAFHPVSNPLGSFHTYSVEWTSAGVNWLIDGSVVRTLNAANAEGGAAGLPQTPMQVKLGTWVAGRKDAPEGTVQWAGGYTDFSKAPFLGYYKSISIVDYAGADGPTSKSVKEYIYGDHSGSWQSIKVELGDGSDDSNDSTSSSAAPSKTKSSAAHSSTKAPSTDAGSTTAEPTTAAPTTDAQTTLATSTPVKSSSGSSPNGTVSVQPTGSTTPSAPPTIPGNAGTRSVAALGSVFAVGAGIALAQFFL
ncbi:cell wall glucanosyltransferase mwg1 [Trichoderma arundinaceum]|uniref:Crh-like protein n=1 Tax=Trichoderma arundinaceum TaxID=490622 RepID=A0A395NW81_TRIAR|nr:cell wall glucanosyltransferase mwg1 [Trichoderma arundinaceum]